VMMTDIFLSLQNSRIYGEIITAEAERIAVNCVAIDRIWVGNISNCAI